MVRIDKWLWAARFYKTRALARAAVQGGKVSLNGQRTKPARTLKHNDELSILRGEERLVVHVQVLADKRGPASVAQTLYAETPESVAARTAAAEQRAAERASRAERVRRPDKRQRRQIIRFRQDQG